MTRTAQFGDAGPVASPPAPPWPGPGLTEPAAERREPMISGWVLTAVVAIMIVLVLAVLGIVAGQFISG